MMRFSTLSVGALLLASTVPAMAQDTAPPPPVTVSGGVTVTSDYRFRGLTQSDEGPAFQGTVNINSDTGFYIGTWYSTIDGKTSLPGYGNEEVDFYGGYTKSLDNGVGFDVGLLYYYYPNGASGLNTDFFEPYASVSYSIGPVDTKLGAAYAWGGQSGLDFTSGNDDNLYVYGEASTAIPGTPLSVNAHLGHTSGSLGLVNPGASDKYWDWSTGVEWSGGPITGGVKYVDTDISNVGNFAQNNGRGSTVLGYVGLSF
ncbi:TorF family putative porin [Stakelama marina]|uniref:TorF family putative porin n=1 Tax=Stakelama marina TaxID=2826939 RepID=A0A8T4IGW6_9SPHN|nr:TorF family putative porin [Stakelama marina]MBR0553272.1 TorF family putative porin [Stakelama marina]